MIAHRTLCRGAGVLCILALAVAPAASVLSHEPAPVHGCAAPTRPADDQNDALWQAYLRAVDDFRGCISDYAAANQRAARAHGAAANAAVEDWNAYVKSNLNVPEDFPWPPEGARTPEGARPPEGARRAPESAPSRNSAAGG